MKHHKYLNDLDWIVKGREEEDNDRYFYFYEADKRHFRIRDELRFYGNILSGNRTKYFRSKILHYFKMMMGNLDTDIDYFMNTFSFKYEVKVVILTYPDTGYVDISIHADNEEFRGWDCIVEKVNDDDLPF